MRLVIKAILNKVDQSEVKGDLHFQYILLERPVYNNFDGTLIRTDFFPATIFNDKITDIDAQSLEGKKVACICYLNSQKSESKGKEFHNLRLKVVSMIELLLENEKAN